MNLIDRMNEVADMMKAQMSVPGKYFEIVALDGKMVCREKRPSNHHAFVILKFDHEDIAMGFDNEGWNAIAKAIQAALGSGAIK